MAQISRALSTSLCLDPNMFTKGMISNITVACGLLVHAVQRREHTATNQKEGRRKKRGGGQSLENKLSAVYHSHTEIPPTESGISTSNSSWLAQRGLSILSGPMRVQRQEAPPCGITQPVCLAAAGGVLAAWHEPHSPDQDSFWSIWCPVNPSVPHMTVYYQVQHKMSHKLDWL